MADGLVQVPPDSTGKKVDTTELTVNAQTVERQRVNIADPAGATAIAPVTSSYGLAVGIQSTGYVPVVSASSGLVGITGTVTASISNTVTVTATAATNPWSSAPGFNLPIVSASSGLVQISGTVTVLSTAGTNPWSSAPSFSVPIVSASSGLVQISGTVTVLSTAGTNPWSSAPGFNVPIVSASSGLTQISGTVVVDARRGNSPLFALISASASGATQLVAASGSNKLKVLNYTLVSSSAVTVKFQSSNTDITGVMPLSSNGGVSANGSQDAWLMETSAAGNLQINLGGAVNVGGHLCYIAEP